MVIQVIFICTGCDYISFFHGFGKASFLHTLYQYADFITSESMDTPGSLSDIDEHGLEDGFLSCVRLIGCAYFQKHKSAFQPAYMSPVTHFNSFKKEGQSPLDHHSKWLTDIRERLWGKIKYEEEMVPSDGALWRHWTRSSWIANMWQQADKNEMTLKPLNGNGWKVTNNGLEIDWDSQENLESVRYRVALLTKGCGCKKGCQTSRCSCVKHNKCGPGCTCINCCNSPTTNKPPDLLQMEIEDANGDEEESDNEDDINELMYRVFGSQTDSDGHSDLDLSGNVEEEDDDEEY